jgi:hypothetical protein
MRTTKTITLPKTNTEVVVYDYITGGEKRKMNEKLLSNSSIDTSTSSIKGDIPMSVVSEVNDLALSFLIKSINGNTENILKTVEDLISTDYDYLIAEINKITNTTDFLGEKAS